MAASEDTRVHAVVLNWNGAERAIACVRSLQATTEPAPQVVVVDNGSTDGSADVLRAQLPETELVCAEHNRGFAAGCNVGIARARAAGADWVWLLNNDAAVRPGALAALLRRAEEDARIGAVGSWLVGETAKVWGGGRVSFFSGLPHHLQVPAAERSLDYLQGASLLLRCAALDDVGMLDEGFFLYWEDTDLCYRLRRAGWRLAVAGDAEVEHAGYGSIALRSPSWDYHFTASSVRFFRRHARLPLVPIAISAGGRLLRRALHREWRNVRAVAAGLRVGVAGETAVP
ncbi:MAG TPA: glycosyltransferase family 2 protein [Myxococcota bacterium]|nr:glycosyltransferase family 2 protein [Myxococcota bacterium]